MTDFNENFSSLLSGEFDAAADELGVADGGLLTELTCIEKHYGERLFFARGGMKSIYRVRDLKSDRTVAMATLNNPGDEMSREKFLREARITAMLQHPNIMPLYDMGLDEEGLPYFTMKFIEGDSLEQALQKIAKKESQTRITYPLNVLLEAFTAVCEAVAYAHSRGVIHLDLKPDNIRLGKFGEVLVCDWGLAKLLETVCDEEYLDQPAFGMGDVTLDGLLKGTPGYMAPEQTDKTKPKTTTADIYALGAILYHILTLKRPIEGSDTEKMLELTRTGEWLPPSERVPEQKIPPGLEAVVMKAMQKDPTKRYATAEELAGEIRRYLQGFATGAEDAGFGKQLKLLIQRNSRISAVLAISFLLIISLVTTFIIRLEAETTKAQQSEKKARQSEETAVSNAHKLQQERSEKMKLAGSAANTLYLEGRSYFLDGQHSKALKRFSEALKFVPTHQESIEQKSGLELFFLKFADSLRTLEGTKSNEFDELKKIIHGHLNLGKKEQKRTKRLMELAIDLHQKSYAFAGRCVREAVFSKRLGFREHINFVFDLTKAINPNQEKWNLKFTRDEAKQQLALDLSGHSKMVYVPGLETLPITTLDISETSFHQSLYLEKLALKSLNLCNSNVTNLAFIEKMPLEELHFSHQTTRRINVLKKVKTLKRLYIPTSLAEYKEILALPPTVKVIIE